MSDIMQDSIWDNMLKQVVYIYFTNKTPIRLYEYKCLLGLNFSTRLSPIGKPLFIDERHLN